jgi:hypothetical protein
MSKYYYKISLILIIGLLIFYAVYSIKTEAQDGPVALRSYGNFIASNSVSIVPQIFGQGNTILILAVWNNSSQVSGSNFSDTLGNVYQVAKQFYDSRSKMSVAIAYALNTKGGTNSITFNAPGNSKQTGFRAVEYAGIAPNSAFDVSAVQAGRGSTAVDNVTSGTAATTANGDLIFGGVFDPNGRGADIKAGNGFRWYGVTFYPTGATITNHSPFIFTEDQTQSSAGKIAATATYANADDYVAIMAAFKPIPSSAPTPPTGLAATVISNSQIDVTWNASTGATSYNIYRNGSYIGSSNTTTFSDTHAAPTYIYNYSVAASNNNGTSIQSQPVAIVIR